MNEKEPRIPFQKLISFCTETLEELGVPNEDARITAEVLVEADLRGINSHGVARMSRYVKGIQQGMMHPKPNPKTLRETQSTATIDADAGLGQPISHRAMQLAIKKAREHL